MDTRCKQDKNRKKKIEISKGYFSKFDEKINLHIQEAQSTLSKIKTK